MSTVNDIWLDFGEKWATQIFEMWLAWEEMFIKLLAENDTFLRLAYSSYFSMIQRKKCEPVSLLPEGEKRELWESAKAWLPNSGRERQKKVACVIHVLIT